MNDSFGNREESAHAGGFGGAYGSGSLRGTDGGALDRPDSETVRLLREMAETQRQCLETQRKALRTARLSLALCVTILLSAAFAVPAALRTVRRAEASLNAVTSLARSVESVAGNAGQAVEQISGALSGLNGEALDDLLSSGRLADGIRSFQDGMASFQTAMDKLNAIDFDALNQAVRDLSGMAAPLRHLAGLLGG